MADYAALFSNINFERTIRKYCNDHEWNLNYIDDKEAVLKFEGDEDHELVQTLYVTRFDTTLEFSVPSALRFDDEDDIPDHVSTALMKANTSLKQGFWCIEKINDMHVYTIMHNEEGRIIDSERFGVIVRSIIKECIKLEKLFLD